MDGPLISMPNMIDFWMVVVQHIRVHQGTGHPATQATRSVRKKIYTDNGMGPKSI